MTTLTQAEAAALEWLAVSPQTRRCPGRGQRDVLARLNPSLTDSAVGDAFHKLTQGKR